VYQNLLPFSNYYSKLFFWSAPRKRPLFYVKDYESRTVPMPCWVIELLEQLKSSSDLRNPFAFIDYDSFIRVNGKIYSKITSKHLRIIVKMLALILSAKK